jgi:hypothetical protein
VSPQIIVEIKEAKHQNEDYAFIYDQITEGVKQISQEANEAARITYTNMVKKLARKYDLEIKEAEKKGSGTKVVGEFKNLEFCGIENK